MNESPHIGVIIAAAGAGTRCGPGEAKQWRRIRGSSLVEMSWRSFCPPILAAAGQENRAGWLGLVVAAAHSCHATVFTESCTLPAHIVIGGETRMESVSRALDVLPSAVEYVAVHDAVRPLWPIHRWDELVDAASSSDGAILATPVTNTLKRSADDRVSTVDRQSLWAAQTPQVFRSDVLREAYRRAGTDGPQATDDAELVERMGGQVAIVESTPRNLKITTPDDWALLERLLMPKVAVTRVGIGYDSHRLGGDCPLILGGVTLSATGGLIGHSDGDALLHAICDALLGAAALGDIGHHFPPSDPQLAGIDSRVLLRGTVGILAAAGFRPVQVDAMVIAEAPRIAPRVLSMRENIAADLRIEISSVSVKATTNEQMGFIGRGEGIAAQAIATICNIE